MEGGASRGGSSLSSSSFAATIGRKLGFWSAGSLLIVR
jgi:hypothetical protein